MPTFIHTPAGYINVDKVDSAPFTKTGRHKIISNGEVVDDNNAGFREVIASIIPVYGDWEVLIISEADDEHPEEILSQPVIGWALTIIGEVKPITPGEMAGVEGEYGLRKAGSSNVYGSGNLGSWKNVEDWKTYHSKRSR